MSQADLDLREWLPALSPYGIGTLELVASVFRAATEDDRRYHLDVATYVRNVIHQQYYDLKLHTGGAAAAQAISDEVDRATMAAIELCDQVYEHNHRYLEIIEAREKELMGEDQQYYYISVEGYHGTDIIIRGDDEPDSRSI